MRVESWSCFFDSYIEKGWVFALHSANRGDMSDCRVDLESTETNDFLILVKEISVPDYLLILFSWERQFWKPCIPKLDVSKNIIYMQCVWLKSALYHIAMNCASHEFSIFTEQSCGGWWFTANENQALLQQGSRIMGCTLLCKGWWWCICGHW